MPSYTISIVPFGTPEYDEAVALRTEVLRRPLGLTFTPEFLASEWRDTHLCMYDEKEGLCATLILTKYNDMLVKVRQVAVAEALQNQGLGGKLMAFAENYARKNGYTEIQLHARASAVPFYIRQNYVALGASFWVADVGLEHTIMQKIL